MTILPPNISARYGSQPRLGVQPDGDGFTATCKCLWLRHWPDQKAAATEYAKHQEKCKGAPEPKATTAPKRAASDWKNREAATWIDKL